jgi:hypothetical protein
MKQFARKDNITFNARYHMKLIKAEALKMSYVQIVSKDPSNVLAHDDVCEPSLGIIY